MSWYYEDKEFTESDISDYIGFIYIITELDTGKKYIGQKIFFNKVAKAPLKGKKNRRITKKSSDWQTYFGSNEELKQNVLIKGVANYKRNIIRLCKAKSEMNYYELKTIIDTDALLKDSYYNSWVSFRINKNQLTKLRLDE